jgi:methyltransferase (TIGR00027 family)
MEDNKIPDSTAVRVALWRALHVEIDSPPYILEDEIGLKLVNPDPNWRERPDMHPQGTSGYRASIVSRARFIEDLVLEKMKNGLDQYVLLGAGLDTFAQRKSKELKDIHVFEIDKKETQEWKKHRLIELGYEIPNNLHFVPVDFENESWIEKLIEKDFNTKKPSVIASTGVSMYLTKEATKSTLQEIATLATGTTFAMTFILTLDLIDPKERAQHEMVYERAKAAGTPFVSFYTPQEIMDLARKCGFKEVRHVSRADLINLYFNDRKDDLLISSGEEFLIATT